MRQCPNCGQRQSSNLTMIQLIEQRNLRQRRLAEMLGRRPRVQSCKKCGRPVFEGEMGFEWDPLLLMDWDARKLATSSAS